MEATLVQSRTSSTLRTAGLAIAGSLLLAASAHVSVPLPWTVVPMTLQDFALLLMALTMGPVATAGAAIAYLLEGAAGLPVFSPHGPGGITQLLGPTGGFLMSFPLAAFVAGTLARRGTGWLNRIAAATAGDALILLSGLAWFAIITHRGLVTAFSMTVLPFLLSSVIKIAASAGISGAITRARQ